MMTTERDRSGIAVISMVTSILLCQGMLAAESYIIGKFSVYKNVKTDKGFANTGLAYDTKRNLLLIGDAYNCKIEFYDKRGRRVRPALDMKPLGVRGLQGVAYDSSDDTIWIWSGGELADRRKGAFIWHCDMQGKRLEDPFEFSPIPGMISYDQTTDSLWAASYDWDDGYKLYRVSCQTKKLVETLEPGEGIDYSEGVAYDPFDGTFWLLGRSHLFHVRKVGPKYELIEKYPNPLGELPGRPRRARRGRQTQGRWNRLDVFGFCGRAREDNESVWRAEEGAVQGAPGDHHRRFGAQRWALPDSGDG